MSNQILKGIRVVELGTHVAIPYCARELSDMGAEVIKIEPPKGESYRGKMGMLFQLPNKPGSDYVLTPYNVNKKSLCMNLKDADSKEALLKLLETADVFLSNTREMALEKLGLGLESLQQRFPRLVIGSVNGFGTVGPDKDRPGYDATSFWSAGGAIQEWSTQGSQVFKPFYGFGDSIAAAQLTAGIMSALYQREKTGKGDVVRVSLLAAGLWHNICGLLRYQAGHKFPKSFYDPIVPLDPAVSGPHVSWDDFLSLGETVEDSRLEEAASAVSGNDIYNIQFTSGTTAKPKGAMLDQKGVLSTAAAYAERLRFSEHEVTCAPLPLFHCFGNVLTMLGAILSGSAVIYPESFRPVQTLALLEQAHCTALMAVPTMYVALMEQMRHTPCDLHCLQKAGVGGAYCPPSLGYEIERQFQIPGLVIGYGLSEAASLCTLADVEAPSELRIESIGHPLSNWEVSLSDPGTGLEDPELTEGELVVRGTGVMRGYYNNQKETERALDRDGWLHTGDLGRRSSSGAFQFAGRLKEIIVRGGENISPSEIEDVLLTMDGVRDCQCVGVADDKYGEEIAACVIQEENAALSEQQVREYVQSRLARYKTPRYVLFMDTFPINGSGKVLKKDLQRTAAELVKGFAHPDRLG